MVFLIAATNPSRSLGMTSYCFPHYGDRFRFFINALDDVLPTIVILNGGKNALWEKRETEQ